jgi:putative ABC transport system permease protein
MRLEHWIYTVPLRLRSLFRWRQVEEELRDELQYHVEQKTEQYAAQGMSVDEAGRAALRDMDGLEQHKEECRDMRRVNFTDDLVKDLRFGLRMLRRSPAFAATAILTLALGIGATTAIFSIVDTLMLKPLAFPDADRLARIESVIAATGHGDVASYPDFLDWRARNHVFKGMAAFRTNDFTLTGAREALHLQGAVVSAQLFSLLSVTPELGRSFLPQEDQPGAAGGTDPVILSYGLWKRVFGSDASVLGRKIQLGEQPFTVVGVMPNGFQFPIQAEPIVLWTTMAVDAEGGAEAMTAQRGAHYLDVIGLLKPGVKVEKAQAEMVAITKTMNKQYPENKPRAVRIVLEVQALIGPLRIPLFVLLGAVGCVLLIVCVNVANLLLARANGRRKEIALRAALGASRRRAIRQLLTESATLGLLGGGLGLGVALALLKLLVRLIPVEVPRLNAIGLDARLLIFALLISLLTGILFGLAPALQASKVDLTESIKENGPGSGVGSKRNNRLGQGLVVSEVILAVVLLAAAGLLIQTFLRLAWVDPGFDPHRVLTFELDSPHGGQPSLATGFFREVVARMSALPEVSSASAVASLPLTGDNIVCSVEIEGQPTPMGSRPSTDFNAVEPNYFRTLGITFVAGRDFTERDNLKSTPVAIVNRTFARRFFSGKNPIGKRIRPGIGNGYFPGKLPMREIVGVIDDVKESDLGVEAAPEVYAALAQCPFSPMFVVMHTNDNPRSIVGVARRQVASLEKDTPIYNVETLDQYLGQSLAKTRFITLLLSSFAGLALLLACLGIYGVISYIVVERRHEIGIRIALGAQKGTILRMVIRLGLSRALIGLAVGVACALKLTHLLSSLLYGVTAGDPLTFVLVSLVLSGVALLACYIPARRATKVDPMAALRYE